MGQLVVYVLDAFLESRDVLISLVAVVLDDPLHGDLKQAEQVIGGDFAIELWFERRQALIDVFECFRLIFGVLKFLILVDAFLDKDFLK